MEDIRDKRFKVVRIVYEDTKTHWGVLATEPLQPLGEIEAELTNKFGNVTLSGNFQGAYVGAILEVTGSVIASKFGKQIQIKFLRVIQDNSNEESVVNFLARSMIKGISVQNALKIYNVHKEKSIEVVLHNPDSLISINGIGNKTVAKIKESVFKYLLIEPLVKYCTDLGLNYSLIMKIHEALGDKALDTIKEDPFHILEIPSNISFKQVDEIYLRTGGSPTGRKRLEQGFLYCLKNMATLEGSTGCKSSTLKNKFYKLLELTDVDNSYEKIARKLENENKVEIGEGALSGMQTGCIYYKEYVIIEENIAEKIKALQDYGVTNLEINEAIVEEEIKNFPFTLNASQIQAVHDCLSHNVAVLTGFGGTGKSSITKALVRIYDRCGFRVQLLSPTAKACRRLEECVPGFQAMTIHKFLGATKTGEFKREEKYFSDTVLVIDESSMLDIILFDKVLSYSQLSTRILLVGDNHQLPSVQAGNVLGDLINSNKVHASILTDIMRQKENSSIIKYCGMTNDGAIFDPCSHNDFHYEEFGDAAELRTFFLGNYLKEVETYGLNEVQVICPYKKGELGMDTMNKYLQSSYNGDSKDLIDNYKLGDKVRHTVNNYEKEVFNGETGVIVDFVTDEDGDDETLVVDYGNKTVLYSGQDLEELVLAYASTVHASQGSEYKVVFVILDDSSVNDFLLTRRLLYTALSRGKQKVYVLAKPYLVDKCITNAVYRPRITKLEEFLRG